MSEADDAVTVSADGITVRKSVDTEQFQTLAVVIELASERDEDARVQVVDEVPADVPMDDVGFHPDYGAEFWSVEDGTVAFERDLAPGEAYTTIYGIRDYPEDDVGALLREPTVGLVETGPDSLDAVVDEERSEAVREFISGEADLPGLGDEIAVDARTAEAAEAVAEATESSPGPGEEPEPAEAEPEPTGADEAEPVVEPEPTAPDEPAPEPAATEPEPVEADEAEPPTAEEAEPAIEAEASGGEDRAVRVPLTGGVVRVLIKELKEGDVDPEDRRLLRDELLDVDSTTETRVTHLQQRVSDLEAYTDALEEFIDEEGTAEQVITDLRDDLADVEREVRSATDRFEDVADRVDAVESQVESVDGEVETVETRTAQLGDRLEDVEDDVTGVDQRADDLGARLDGVSSDVDAVDDRVGTVDGRVDDLRDELNTLRRNLRNDVQAVQDDLEEFEAFQDRLSSVFGGGGGPGGSPDRGDGGT